MPIANVVSTLPDKDYVLALERELAEIKAEVARLRSEVNALGGRS